MKREKRKTKTITDPEVKHYQTSRKSLRIKINAAKTSSQKEYLKKQRNKQMKNIEKKLQEMQEQKITENIKEIEQCKDDSNKMYSAIRNSNRNKPKEEIVVDTENGITTNKEEAIKIVTNWFNKTFNAENQSNFPQIPPKR